MLGHTPGAAIAIVKDSTVVYIKGFGTKAVNSSDSVDIHTVFRIASVSKCFAAFLTGILVEDSVLAWNDPVWRYLPDFSLQSPEETRRLTVRNILSHTTGLPFHAYTNLIEDGLSLDDMLLRLREVKLATPVGQAYSYQNVAYSLIGKVIESATHKRYENWIQEKVFGPLHMTDASIDYQSMIANTNLATPHVMRHGGWQPARITDTYYNAAPAGGVNASISDMARWMTALLGNHPEVIQRQTLDTLFTPVIKAPSKNRNYGRLHKLNDSYYGLGWRILHYPNDTLVYHGGYVNGFRSEVAIRPKDKIAICILANAPGELADNGIPLFFDLLQSKRTRIRQWDDAQRKKILRDTLAVPPAQP